MKFSTGSSSSSLASDSLSRKSTLCIYTDADFLNGPEKMDANSSGASSGSGIQDDVVSLKREVTTLHNALQLQSSTLAREQMRAGGLAMRLIQKDNYQEARRAHADKQAATLLRALLVLEATLRREKTVIMHKLQIKDLKIQKQKEEIAKLKSQRRAHCASCQQLIGFTSEQTNIETDPEFHSLESVENHKFERSMSYHESQHQPFQKNSRLVKSFQLAKSDVKCDNTSSSEEVFEETDPTSLQSKNSFIKNKQPFVRKDVTRRSRKYSLRKQTSVNSDTSQKRQTRSLASSSSTEEGGFSEKDTKFYLEDSEDIGDTISKDIQRASNRIDELINNPQQFHSLDANVMEDSKTTNGRRLSISECIDNMHGVKKVMRFQETNYNSLLIIPSDASKNEYGNRDKPWYTNVSDPEQDMGCEAKRKLNKNRSMSVNDILSSGTDKGEISRTSGDGANPTSSSSLEINIEKTKYNAENSDDKTLKFESSANNNFDAEPNENWYASASDPDDEQSCEIYKNNPVLECVNQILLQNSLDENSNDSLRAYESPSPKSSTKRVQFSTLNSISFDESVGKNGQDNNSNNFVRELLRVPERRSSNKIVKFSLETASEHSYEVPITSEGYNYEVQSIYSNDYEPILTQPSEPKETNPRPVPMPRSINNINKSNKSVPQKQGNTVRNIAHNLESKMNGNHYVDMEAKLGGSLPCPLNKKKVPRIPPALPPKPKNLVSKFKLNPNSTAALMNNTSNSNSQNSDSVGSTQRPSDVHNAPNISSSSSSFKKNASKSSTPSEPDYCSISEINVPVVSSGMRGLILTQATVEIHTEKFSSAEKRSAPKLATISKITSNKISDKDIPKLPQVTEIIIPDDDEITGPPKISMETFPGKTLPHIGNKLDLRNSIQIGHSVSTILSDIKNRNVGIEDVSKCISIGEMNGNFPTVNHIQQKSHLSSTKEHASVKAERSKTEMTIFETVENDSEKFDLSQNFEEFKIDDCEFAAEEYRISSSENSSTDGNAENTREIDDIAKLSDALSANNSNEGLYRIEFTAENDLNSKNNEVAVAHVKNYSKMSNKPDLLSNIENIDTDSVRYSDLESSNSSSSNCGSYKTVKCEPATIIREGSTAVPVEQQKTVPFEYFLESSGLCSKSILTPSRPPNSNHKSVMKPKDVKMKSKTPLSIGRATPLYERLGTNTAIKYFEPYL